MTILAYILIWTASFLWFAENIPQIVKILKTKNVESLSFWYFFMCWLAYVFYIVGTIILKNYMLTIAHLPSFFLLILIIILILKYRK